MDNLLAVKDLIVRFKNAEPDEYAVKGVTLEIKEGEILGLVGESGSGKSVTAMSISGLIKKSSANVSGQIIFDGKSVNEMSEKELRKLHGNQIAFVFQEPMPSFDPLIRIGKQIEEALTAHTKLSKKQRYHLAIEAMKMAELDDAEQIYNKYPHELSGGMLQRCMIASAIICKPKLLFADEPTTALDVSIQTEILKLIKKLNQENNMAILFISHDLNIIRKLCDRVIVMKDGHIVESGKTEDIFNSPKEDYTKRLIASIPSRDNKTF